MRKPVAILLIIVMSLTLCACGGEKTENKSEGIISATGNTDQQSKKAADESSFVEAFEKIGYLDWETFDSLYPDNDRETFERMQRDGIVGDYYLDDDCYRDVEGMRRCLFLELSTYYWDDDSMCSNYGPGATLLLFTNDSLAENFFNSSLKEMGISKDGHINSDLAEWRTDDYDLSYTEDGNSGRVKLTYLYEKSGDNYVVVLSRINNTVIMAGFDEWSSVEQAIIDLGY